MKEKKRDERGNVFAEGEVTGHYHGVKEDTVRLFEEGGQIVRALVECPSPLKHQEHKTTVLPKGDAKVGIVKTWDAFEKTIEKIKD